MWWTSQQGVPGMDDPDFLEAPDPPQLQTDNSQSMLLSAIPLIGGVIGAVQRNAENRFARNQYEEDMRYYKMEREKAIKRAEEYNSPKAVVARLREAGLNPYAFYGKGNDQAVTIDFAQPEMQVDNSMSDSLMYLMRILTQLFNADKRSEYQNEMLNIRRDMYDLNRKRYQLQEELLQERIDDLKEDDVLHAKNVAVQNSINELYGLMEPEKKDFGKIFEQFQKVMGLLWQLKILEKTYRAEGIEMPSLSIPLPLKGAK